MSQVILHRHATGTLLQACCQAVDAKPATVIDENHAVVYRWLLERNLRMFGVAFAVDHSGDIFLDARLPLSAILNRGTGPAVYLVDGAGALELRPVTVATFTENAALVSAGIQDGDSVVTLGVQKLVAGEQVRAVATR